jgi:hypothetical protein
MKTIRKEVQELIRTCERIQTDLVHGDTLNEDEKDFIHVCAAQLMDSAGYGEHFPTLELRHRESRSGAGLQEGEGGMSDKCNDRAVIQHGAPTERQWSLFSPRRLSRPFSGHNWFLRGPTFQSLR